MCPPSLKRGDSDGDVTDNNNFNIRVGEEQHPHMQMHHHGVDNSTSSASANIIVTSSDTINTGTCYDGFKNEALWKGSDYFDNQKQTSDGGDEGCVSLFLLFVILSHLHMRIQCVLFDTPFIETLLVLLTS